LSPPFISLSCASVGFFFEHPLSDSRLFITDAISSSSNHSSSFGLGVIFSTSLLALVAILSVTTFWSVFAYWLYVTLSVCYFVSSSGLVITIGSVLEFFSFEEHLSADFSVYFFLSGPGVASVVISVPAGIWL
jgi:glucan phosphoethanolaminetransferase (alkaline phosphatase superfamily)